jgi:uncharacterized ParB-like nuclease family protein
MDEDTLRRLRALQQQGAQIRRAPVRQAPVRMQDRGMFLPPSQPQQRGSESNLDRINRFTSSANERFLGGGVRSFIRGVEWALPGDQKQTAQNLIDKAAPDAGTAAANRSYLTRGADKNSWGGKVGTGMVVAKNVGEMVIPAAWADKAVKGTRLAQNLAKGGKLQRAVGFGARTAPGSILASGVEAAQTLGRGDEVNLGKSAGIGLAADLSIPVLGRALRPVGRFLGGRLSSRTVDTIARETDENAIKTILKQNAPDIEDSALTQLSRELSAAKTPKDVDAIIKRGARQTPPQTPPINRDVITSLRSTKTPQETNVAVKALFPELDEPTTTNISTRLAQATNDTEVEKVIQEAQVRQAEVKATVQEATPTGEQVAPNSQQQARAEAYQQAVTEQPVATQAPEQPVTGSIDSPTPQAVAGATDATQVPQARDARSLADDIAMQAEESKATYKPTSRWQKLKSVWDPRSAAIDIDKKFAKANNQKLRDLNKTDSLEALIEVSEQSRDIAGQWLKDSNIAKVIQKYGRGSQSEKDFNVYRLFMRDLEQRADGRPVLFRDVNSEEMLNFVKEFEARNPGARQDLADLAADIRAVQEMASNGDGRFVSAEEIGRARTKKDGSEYQFFTPVQRALPEEKASAAMNMDNVGTLGRQKVLQEFTGSDMPLDPTFDALTDYVETVYRQKGQARVVQKFAERVEQGVVDNSRYIQTGDEAARIKQVKQTVAELGEVRESLRKEVAKVKAQARVAQREVKIAQKTLDKENLKSDLKVKFGNKLEGAKASKKQQRLAMKAAEAKRDADRAVREASNKAREVLRKSLGGSEEDGAYAAIQSLTDDELLEILDGMNSPDLFARPTGTAKVTNTAKVKIGKAQQLAEDAKAPQVGKTDELGVKGNNYTTYHPEDVFENESVFKNYKLSDSDSRYIEDISQQALPADSTIRYSKVMPTELLSGTEATDPVKVANMVKAIKSGQELPPIIVENTPFTKNGQKLGYTVFDGHNRLEAYKQAGVKDVKTAVIVNAEDYTAPRATPVAQVGKTVEATPTKTEVSAAERISKKSEAHAELIDKIADLKMDLESVENAKKGLTREMVELRPDPTTGRQTIVGIDANGNSFRIETTPEYATLLQGLNREKMNSALRAMKKFQQPIRESLTGLLNPSFQISQAIYNTMMTPIISEGGIRTLGPRAVTEAIKSFSGTSELTNLLRANGAIRYGGNLQKLVSDSTADALAAQADAISKVKWNANPVRGWQRLSALGGKLDEAARTAAASASYDAAIRRNLTPEQALAEAVYAYNNTLPNFSNLSSFVSQADAVAMYAGASQAGTRTVLRAIKRNPARVGARLAVVGSTLTAATAYNLAQDQGQEFYKDMQESGKQYVLDNNVVIVLPGARKDPKTGEWTGVIKLPIAPELRPVNASVWKSFNTNEEGVPAKTYALSIFDFVTGQSRTLNNPLVQTGSGIATGKDPRTGRDIYDETMTPEEKQTAIKKYIAGSLGTPGKVAAANSGERGQAFLDTFVDKVYGAKGLSEGGKFYKTEADAIKAEGLNQNELNAYRSIINPRGKDLAGNDIKDKTFYDSSAKANVWLKMPKTFAVSKAINDAAKAEGKPGDPLFDLPPDRLKIVLNMQANFSPGNMEDKAILQLNPWLENFNKSRSDFFDKVQAKQETDLQDMKNQLASNPNDKKLQERVATATESMLSRGVDPMGQKIPKASKELEAKLEAAKGLSGKDAAIYYEANPDVTDFYAELETYQRAKRAFLGLPQFDRYPTPSPEVDALMKEYNALPKDNGPLKRDGTPSSPARSAWIRANPDKFALLTDQWNKIGLFNLQKDGALAVYEGIDMPQDTIDQYQAGGSGGSGYARFGSGGRGGRGGKGSSEESQRQYLSQLLSGVKAGGKAPTIDTTPNRAKIKVKTPSGKGRRFKRIKLT